VTTLEPTIRRPTEDDQPRIAGLVDHWFAGRRVWPLVGREWFRHFADTSLLLEATDGAPVAFLLGFRSPGRPEEAVLHLVAVEPNVRRQGHGRRLVERFVAEQAAFGVLQVRAVAWPDDRPAIEFFRAIDFRPADGPGSQNLYGVPAWPDYEFPGEDRAVLVRSVAPAG
jgi:GNAT superfamily N-acetyltransferase